MENEVNMQSVEKHVLQVMGHKPCLETLKHTQLIKQIGADLKHLKNAYKKALYQKEHTGFENWLLDNFYILENEGKSTQRQLKNMPALPSTQDKCAQLYHVLFAAVSKRGKFCWIPQRWGGLYRQSSRCAPCKQKNFWRLMPFCARPWCIWQLTL